MRKLLHFSTVLSLFLQVPASITRAQSVSITGVVYENNTAKIPFTVPEGKVNVYVPEVMSVGDRITGTVVMEVSGKNDKEKSKNLDVLKQYGIKIADVAIDLKNLSFRPSDKPGTATSNFNLPDNWWGIAHNVAPISLTKMKEPVAKTEIQLMQNTGGGPFVASGPPTGEFSFYYGLQKKVITGGENLVVQNNKVWTLDELAQLPDFSYYVNDKPVAPLCSSPRQTVIPASASVTGKNQVTVKNKNGNTIYTDEFYKVAIKATIDKMNLRTRERTNMHVLVDGVGECPYPVSMAIVNSSKQTVLLDKGEHQTYLYNPLESQGNKDYAPLNIHLGVTGVVPGNFDISANLILPSFAFGDVFHQQKSALKTPEDYNAWVDALNKDLKAYADKQGSDEVGKAAKANAQRAIDNIQKCYDQNKLDELKAFADVFLRHVNIPKGAATMWLSGFEAYKAAIKAITGTLGGKAELIDWEVIKNGLEFIRNMGEQLKDERLQNGASNAKKMVEAIQKAGETKEKLQELNDKLEELNDATNGKISFDPSRLQAYSMNDLMVSSFIAEIPSCRIMDGTTAILNAGTVETGVFSLNKIVGGNYEIQIGPPLPEPIIKWVNSGIKPAEPLAFNITGPKQDGKKTSLDFEKALITEIKFPEMDAAGKNLFKFTITLKSETVIYNESEKKTDGSGVKKQKKWTSGNFRFEMGGLPCKNIIKIDSIKLAPKNTGGQMYAAENHPGKLIDYPDFAEITFRIQIQGNDVKNWQGWFDENVKNNATKNGGIDYLNEKGESLFFLPLNNVKPVKVTPAGNNIYTVTIASVTSAKGDVSGNDAVSVPTVRPAVPDQINDLVAFYDPYKSVMHIVPDYLQQTLDYFRAIQISPGKFSMQNITADRAPVNCIFTVIPSNPLDMYLESQAVTAKILCQQQAAPVGKPVLIDTITDIKTGTSLIVYKNAKCGEEKRGHTTGCQAEKRGAWDFSVKPPKSITIETGKYSKRDYLPIRKCEAGNEFCVEALVVHIIEYWYMDKDCKGMIDVKKFKGYFCW